MGSVWLATDRLLGRTVAVKRVGLLPGRSSLDLQRAEREARLAAMVNHPHVVAVFDLVPEGDHQWLVMEYVEGLTLAALIATEGAVSPRARRPADRAGGRRAGGRTRGRDRAPRRQALEHLGHPGRTGEAHRLRDRPGGGGRDPDRDGHGDGITGLPGSRSGLRGDGDPRERRLVDGRHGVPRPRRQTAVRHLRERPGDAVQDRARRAASAPAGRPVRSRAGSHDGQATPARGGRCVRCATSWPRSRGLGASKARRERPSRPRCSPSAPHHQRRRGRLLPTRPRPKLLLPRRILPRRILHRRILRRRVPLPLRRVRRPGSRGAADVCCSSWPPACS